MNLPQRKNLKCIVRIESKTLDANLGPYDGIIRFDNEKIELSYDENKFVTHKYAGTKSKDNEDEWILNPVDDENEEECVLRRNPKNLSILEGSYKVKVPDIKDREGDWKVQLV
ncbi:MAG: hypothetical protein AB7I27_19185 [Bacteriovoracaceae bacterium]